MIEIVNSIERFEAVRCAWDLLYRNSDFHNPFLTHEWLSHWVKYFGGNRWLAALAWSGNDGNLDAAVVLRTNDRTLGFIETDHSYYPGVLSSKKSEILPAKLLADIGKKFNPERIDLLQCPDKTDFLEDIKKQIGRRWLVIRKNPQVLRVIEIAESVEYYLDNRDKKIRHELRRKKRRVEKEGCITLDAYDSQGDDGQLFKIVASIERDSWKQESGTAIISSKNEEHFYKSLFECEFNTWAAKGYVLKINEKPVSYVLGIEYGDCFYALKTSFKEAYANLSPGTVLFLYVIEKHVVSKRKIRKIELLGSDARWKKELSTGSCATCTYEVYPVGLSSIIYSLAYLYIRPALKRFLYNQGSESKSERNLHIKKTGEE